mgnify:CR=1 FL=1
MNAVAETRYLSARMTEAQLLEVLAGMEAQAQTDEEARAIFSILAADLTRRLGLDATKVATAPLGAVATLRIAVESKQFWVHIERQDTEDIAVGPFATKELAEHDLEHGEVVEDLCLEDCLDAYVFEGIPAQGVDQVKPEYRTVTGDNGFSLVRLQGVDE